MTFSSRQQRFKSLHQSRCSIPFAPGLASANVSGRDTIRVVTEDRSLALARSFRLSHEGFRGFVIVATLVVTLGAAGCKKTHGADVVASVNGHAIPRADLDRYYDAQQKNKQDPQPSTPEQADSDKMDILRGLIDQEIIEQRAAKMNLTATNDEVDAKLTEMKAPYTEDVFNDRLRQSGQTLDNVRRDLRRSITLDKLLNKEINSKINVTDSQVSSYFQAHKSEFNLIENRYHLAQIVVTSLPSQGASNLQGSKATSDVEAKKKIQTLKNRIDAGENFGALAADFSENPQTSSNGGDMGFPSESQLRGDAQTFAAVSKLKAGETTDILPMFAGQGSKQVVGYAILKLISRESAGQRDLGNPVVQQSIRDQLRNTRSQLLTSAYREMIRDQAKVENYLAEEIFTKGAK